MKLVTCLLTSSVVSVMTLSVTLAVPTHSSPGGSLAALQSAVDELEQQLTASVLSQNITLVVNGSATQHLDDLLDQLLSNVTWDELWRLFKHGYSKHHTDSADTKKKTHFVSAVRLIIIHNVEASLGVHAYTLGVNELTDKSHDEVSALRGHRQPSNHKRGRSGSRSRRQSWYNPPTYYNTVPVSQLRSSVNWTAAGAVTAVLNQGSCGACWAFSALVAVQAQYYFKTKKLVMLSEQNLIDCSQYLGNNGCTSGAFQYAFLYIMYNGIDPAWSYPYRGKTGSCAYQAGMSVTSISSWWSINYADENALKQAVDQVGPIVVGIDASPIQFQYYRSGVFAPSSCTTTNINHSLVIVGYGTTASGQSYWLCQNSWGTSWGINGYIMIARNSGNMCGIASDAAFAII
jgi:hypothetical protein